VQADFAATANTAEEAYAVVWAFLTRTMGNVWDDSSASSGDDLGESRTSSKARRRNAGESPRGAAVVFLGALAGVVDVDAANTANESDDEWARSVIGQAKASQAGDLFNFKNEYQL
jgi:hypothetical protein